MKPAELKREFKSIREELQQIKQLAMEVMNAEAAAQFLGIGKSSLDKITRPDNMLIPVAKLGGKKKMFMRKDLIAYVEKHKTEILSA